VTLKRISLQGRLESQNPAVVCQEDNFIKSNSLLKQRHGNGRGLIYIPKLHWGRYLH